MIPKFYLLVILIWIANLSYGQDSTIHLEEKSNKPFLVNNRAYSFKERKLIFKNTEAIRLLNSAHSKFIGSQILAGLGGGFLGFTLSDVLLSKKDNFTEEQWYNKKKIRTIFIGGGIALVGVAIPVSKSGLKKVRKAVEIENGTLHTESNNTSLKFNVNSNGIGLTMNF